MNSRVHAANATLPTSLALHMAGLCCWKPSRRKHTGAWGMHCKGARVGLAILATKQELPLLRPRQFRAAAPAGGSFRRRLTRAGSGQHLDRSPGSYLHGDVRYVQYSTS